MKPKPDDHSEVEPPMTRAHMATDMFGPPRDSELTQDAKTQPMFGGPPPPPSDEYPSMGGPPSSGGLGPTPTNTGGMAARGVSGPVEPGQILYGKYKVESKLGAGAMGEVWLVRHTAFNRLHALKLIIPRIASSDVALMRFKREFQVMAKLQHVNAVRIYDARIDEDGGFIEMEYVEGRTIHDILSAAKKPPGPDPTEPLMPLDWIQRILRQLCEVLQSAHRHEIVHRDLKPSNLMLVADPDTGEECLKVLDFGIAKVRDDPDNVVNVEMKTRDYIGTPSYSSPEQILSREDIDGRADLYSIGVMLYEFVTGRLPFRGSAFQVIHQHNNEPPPKFAQANPKLKPLPEIERVILRALSKQPDQRPRTAGELFKEFSRALEVDLKLPPKPGGTWDEVQIPAKPRRPEPTPPEHDTEHDIGPGRGGYRVTEKDTIPDLPGPPPPPPPPPHRAFTTALVLAFALASVGGLAYWIVNGKSRTPKLPPPPLDPPAGYASASEKPTPGVLPDKLSRISDDAKFYQYAPGIYLPEGYKPEDSTTAEDGWPAVLVPVGDYPDMRFLRIPGSEKEWMMGDASLDGNADEEATPAHAVKVSGFYIQETEVTNGQFARYVQANGPPGLEFWSDWNKDREERFGKEKGSRHPAVNLKFSQARAFARALNALLPTEAQWEYAAKSRGLPRKYVWGDEPAPNRDRANIDSQLSDQTTQPVRSFPKTDVTAQGVVDLVGNVQEMCRDVWGPYSKPAVAPTDPCNADLSVRPLKFAVRGGSWNSNPDACSTTTRKGFDDDDFARSRGFRLVLECPDARPR